jgi:DNA ligase (NAD+)
LVRNGWIKDFADIYSLKKEKLLKLELFKDKKVNNLLSAIEKSKKQPLSRLIYALGIRHVGEKAAFVLARQFKAMDNLLTAKTEDLDTIYEVGPVLAQSIVDYFSLSQTRRMIEELRKAGLNFKEITVEAESTPLLGKTVVFTGELKDYSRLDAEELVRRLAGNVSSGVSKATDFVVAGENPGSKYEKAKKLGVKILGEKEFKEMIK